MRMLSIAKVLAVSAGLWVLGSPAARADRDADAASPGTPGVPTAATVRIFRLDSPITVDGALTEPAWQRPPAVTRLLQADPVEGAAPSESTWVWVAYDDEALYVAARCWDSHPDSIIATLVRRDVDVTADRFYVALDPFHDRRSGYYFGVNAAGVLYDGTVYNDNSTDDSWDGVWEAHARRDERGWTLEMKIPFSQMRFRRGSAQVWGIDFRRDVARNAEQDWVVFTPKRASGFCSRFPDLVGLENGHHSAAIELLPYMTGKAEYQLPDVGDPFHDGSRYTPAVGGDLRMAVGNSLTLNATVNPDFGQVEVDPAVVNLSDVETFFQEKRPFFTENAQIFNFGTEGASDYWNFNWYDPKFFYTRRIGRAPQGSLPDDTQFSDVPVATRILGAAKLTGKLAPSWNFGTLHALTSEETADIQLDGLRSSLAVEPLTYYGVARGQKLFREGYNGLGLMTTIVDRRFGHDGLENQLDRQSLMTGIDGWHFLDSKKMWVLSGWAAMSRVAGTAAQMIDVQTDPRHYLQRPDARHLGVDSAATSLTGYGARVWLNKQEGNWFSNSAIGFMDPKFDDNDIGFQPRSDLVNGHLGVGYRWTKPHRWFKYAHVLGAVFESRDFDWNETLAGEYAAARVQSNGGTTLNLDAAYNPRYVDNLLTRGGPLALTNPGWQYDGNITTDSHKRVYYSISYNSYWISSTRSFSTAIAPAVTWTPRSNFSVQVGPEVDRNVDDAHYVATVAGPGSPADFGGNHYVFARLDQTTVSANIRLDVSFTPNVSLRTYVQPLVSSGHYGDYKELARSRSYDFLHHSSYDPVTQRIYPDPVDLPDVFESLSQPSFNFKSLRGNAVLRWEYRPGSTFFLVWTQQRTNDDLLDGLDFARSLDRLVSAKPDDIFLAKVTYHFEI